MVKLSKSMLRIMENRSKNQETLMWKNGSVVELPSNKQKTKIHESFGFVQAKLNDSFQIQYESTDNYKKGRYILKRNKFKEAEEMKKKIQGFTMVELLVVLVIIGILAAVATPLLIRNTQRARASEAVATMSQIRQAMREYMINANTFFDIDPVATAGSSAIDNGFPTIVDSSKNPTPSDAGVGVNVEISQYFSNRAFSVKAVTSASETGDSGKFTNPNAQGFIITADGTSSDPCTSALATNCAIKGGEVRGVASGPDAGDGAYVLEMDNTGRIFISYDNGKSGTWEAY